MGVVDHMAHTKDSEVENMDPSAPLGVLKVELPAERMNIIERFEPIVDEDGPLGVTEVVPPSTVVGYQLPRTRAQSCYLTSESDYEPEAEEGRSAGERRTASPDSQHGIPETDASNQPSVESSIGTDEELLSVISVKHESIDDIDFRPPKRRRVLMDAVVVPTLASILRQRSKVTTREEKEQQMKKLQNPKVKKIKGTFSIETVWNRLNTIGHKPYPITLDDSIAGVMVTREFMTAVYGGSIQPTFPKIANEKFRIHGLDDFMYLNLTYNPSAPQMPGAPGLFCTTPGRPAYDWPMVQRVLTRIDNSAWHYVGQYKLTPAPSLTKEEWAAEDRQVRNTWATQICKRKWGRTVRARIYLRKRLQREFTEAELDQELGSDSKFDITPEQVSRAFLRGEESLAVWTMQCVGYDEDFQHNLAEKFPIFESKLDGSKKRSGANDLPATAKEPKSKAGQKRKRQESKFSDSDLDDPASEDSDGNLDTEVPGHRIRGDPGRSRPTLTPQPPSSKLPEPEKASAMVVELRYPIFMN